MAHVFIGNRAKVDDEVLSRVSLLPDDYWVFAEFDITGRNIDWFITRAVSAHGPESQHSVLILTELKRIAAALEGSVDEQWRLRTSDGTWTDIIPNSQSDLNYYWQSVNAANALSQWLWNNQQRFLEPGNIRPTSDFKVWPDLLIVSPPDVIHRLPLQPPTRFGQWWYGIDDWHRHIETWRPRFGVGLTADNMRLLADALGLQRQSPVAEPVSAPPDIVPDTAPALLFATWLQTLESRIKRIEDHLRLES